MFADTPYFDLRIKISSLGFPFNGSPKRYEFFAKALDLPNHLADDLAYVSLRLGLGSGGNDIEGIDHRGFVDIQQLTQEEIRSSFDGAFGNSSDVVSGCLASIFSD